MPFGQLVELLRAAQDFDSVADAAVPEFRDDGSGDDLLLYCGTPLEIDNPCRANEQPERHGVRPEVKIVDGVADKIAPSVCHRCAIVGVRRVDLAQRIVEESLALA